MAYRVHQFENQFRFSNQVSLLKALLCYQQYCFTNQYSQQLLAEFAEFVQLPLTVSP